MAQNYNDDGNSGCRIGNWVEEQILLKTTGVARYDRTKPNGIDTFSRLILHDTRVDPKSYQSTTHKSYSYPKREIKVAKYGPREQKMNERLRKLAEEETKREVEKEFEEKYEPLSSEKQSKYVQYSSDHFPSRKPRGSVYRTRDPIDPSTIPDKPITMYTQRIIEGDIHMTPVNSTNPFNRNTLFSNEVEDGIKIHEEDLIQQAYYHAIDAPNTKIVSGLGSELSIELLLPRVKRAYKKNASIAPNLLQNKDRLSSAQVWEYLSSLKIDVTARQLRALVAHFSGKSFNEMEIAIAGNQEQEEKSMELKPALKILYCINDEEKESIIGVDPTQIQQLSLPEDESYIRALLRKYDIVPDVVVDVQYGKYSGAE